MKKVGEGYWVYNGCDVYLAEHPQLYGKYEVFKGCDFIKRASDLKEAKEIIISNFGKMSGGGARKNVGAKPKYFEKTKTIPVQCPISKIPELKEVTQEK